MAESPAKCEVADRVLSPATEDAAGESGATEIDEDEVIADFEVNVDSRFIDFSLATPWEHLVADLEKAIKNWTRQKGVFD